VLVRDRVPPGNPVDGAQCRAKDAPIRLLPRRARRRVAHVGRRDRGAL